MFDKLLRLLLNPQRIVFRTWKALPLGSLKLRLDYDVFPRPHYAYCTYHAARLAEILGIERISLIEFGVAGGNGLVELVRRGELDPDAPCLAVCTGSGLKDTASALRAGGGVPEAIEPTLAALEARLAQR